MSETDEKETSFGRRICSALVENYHFDKPIEVS